MTTKRKKGVVRQTEILEAALKLAEVKGYQKVTRDNNAKRMKLSGPAIQHHFSTMEKLRRQLMRYAIQCGNLRVIAQGLAVGDAHAKKAPDAMKREAMEKLL